MLFLSLLLLASCGKGEVIDSIEDVGMLYSTALDSIMEKEEALGHDISYIAIDISKVDELNEQDNEAILSYFEQKYKVKAMNATYEYLIEEGLYHPDTMRLHGVLLKIEKVDFVSEFFIFEGSKYRAEDSAATVKGVVQYKNGQWLMKESKVTRVS
ncbi:hypothetical protein D3C78_896750 [compost metagenome]